MASTSWSPPSAREVSSDRLADVHRAGPARPRRPHCAGGALAASRRPGTPWPPSRRSDRRTPQSSSSWACSSRSRSSPTPGSPGAASSRPGGTWSWPCWRWPCSFPSPRAWTCCAGWSRSSPGMRCSARLQRCARCCRGWRRPGRPARPAVLGHRELILTVTALVTLVRSYRGSDLWLAMTALAVVAPVVMAVRQVRRGAGSPRRLAVDRGRCRPRTSGSSSS
jgi:hypothetical protein